MSQPVTAAEPDSPSEPSSAPGSGLTRRIGFWTAVTLAGIGLTLLGIPLYLLRKAVAPGSSSA